MSFRRWSSVLERQQGLHLALCASALLDELISESSGDEDSSLSEGNSSNSSNSNSSSSDSTLSKSSTEAELVGISDALPQIIWFKHFLEAQGHPPLPAHIWEDNQSTICLAKRDQDTSKFDIFGFTTF